MSNVAHTYLSTLLPESSNAVQLLPLGKFSAQDGRPGNLQGVACKEWVLTEARARDIAASFASRKNKLLFDYEHAALFLKGTGQPTPAAGWGEALTVKADGLYAEPVTWTPKAHLMIANQEYRYTSPVFRFDTDTGEVLGVDMCAITNDPALDGMAELQVALSKLNESSTITQGSTSMDELLERLRWFLNLPITATEQDIIVELDKLKTSLGTEAQAAASFDLVKHLASFTDTVSGHTARIAALTTQVTTLEKQTEPDPARYVALSAYTAAQAKVAELSNQINTQAVGALIATATAEGRLLGDADVQWATSFATKHGPDALKEALAARQPIPALAGTQTGGKPPAHIGIVSLTTEQRDAARLMGQSEADYAATLALS